MLLNYLPVIFVLLAGMVLSVLFKKLTLPAALTGGIIGFLVFAGTGYMGIVMMATFFIAGTVATSWKSKLKAALGVAESHTGRRNAIQVLANAGVAAVIGLLSLLHPTYGLYFQLMIGVCFSAATADTLSSELGTVYGRRFYNIMTLRRDKRGLDGVISLEGTFFGLAGSMLIAAIYGVTMGGWTDGIWVIVLCGTFGNLADSVMGATLERKGRLSNDAVNFLNTLSAVLLAWTVCCLL
jgi:uncharacterized protein (TIGR00297 family)